MSSPTTTTAAPSKKNAAEHLTLGHSPDSDDAFMFYALAEGKLDQQGFEFEHILQDIQTLNERARKAELDISAISIHNYAYVLDEYALLHSGASMGDNYGPRLVGKQALDRDELLEARIAVPGKWTSAYLALQLYLDTPGDELELIFLPFDEIFDALNDNEADIGLIIHEGQLTFQDEGFVLTEDLGEWWYGTTDGLPLPLGGNVVKKSLGKKKIATLSKLLTESIQYALDHRESALEHAMRYSGKLTVEEADKFVSMYVNELTVDYGERGEEGVREFLTQAHDMGLIPEPVNLEFV
ncbi:MAG: MqnA/MqnD/SBP family protein [Verrucomicrobiota bacterium]